MKRHVLTAVIILSVTITLILFHHAVIDRPFLDARMQMHAEIIDGTSESPYRYRVLIPFIAQGLIQLLNGLIGQSAWQSFVLSYVIIEATLILILLTSIYIYLSQWLEWEFSIAGVLALATVFPLTLLEQYFQPWSYLEAALLALMLASIRSKHRILLGAICVLLASLNRESGVFVALGFFLVTFDFQCLFSGFTKRRLHIDWKSVFTGICLLMIWLFVFLGLHYLRGNSPQIHSLTELWTLNTKPIALIKAGFKWLAFIGLLWALAIPGFRISPVFFKALAWLIPFYLLTILAWGIWSEVRLLLPIYVILLPPGLLYVKCLIGIQEPI